MEVTDPGLHPRTRAALEKAGWSEDYHRAHDAIGEELVKMGFSFPGCARRFLERFGALFVYQEPVVRQANHLLFHTDALGVARRIMPGWHEEWRQLVGKPLCPIGETGYGQFMLLMDDEERVFGIDMMGNMTFWADSGLELLDMVFTGGSFRPVDEDDRR